jgi:uncharacterized phage protein (TIGR01671 family)
MRDIKFRAIYKGRIVGSIVLNQNEGDGVQTAHHFGGSYDNLSEYTGLKDKNGKEIYEGDILIDDQKELLEVKFGELPLDKSGDCVCTYQSFYCKCYGKLGVAPMYDCANIGEWMEVIGNIYENPELISSNKQV